jgi:hypothetical protein
MKDFLNFAEKFLALCLVVVLSMWGYQKAIGWKPETAVYHFKGTFGGKTLWEYSARGDDVAIWGIWSTNYPDLSLHMVTGTVHQLVTQKNHPGVSDRVVYPLVPPEKK